MNRESRTIILFVGIRYSMPELISDLNNYMRICLTRNSICVRLLYH